MNKKEVVHNSLPQSTATPTQASPSMQPQDIQPQASVPVFNAQTIINAAFSKRLGKSKKRLGNNEKRLGKSKKRLEMVY